MTKPERGLGLPNKLSLLRILFVPPVALFLLWRIPHADELAATVLGAAAITDWLDGFLARRQAQVTAVGKLLDPIADKLLVVGALIPLVQLGRAPAWVVVVIVCRELAVTGLRSIAASQGIVIRAHEMGKVKTVTQMVALFLLVLDYQLGALSFRTVGNGVLLAAMALSIASGIEYFARFWGKVDLSI